MTFSLPRIACLAGFVACASAAPVAQKTWFFTTRDSLTVDVRAANGLDVDWSATRLTVQPATGGDARQFTPSATSVRAAEGVERLTFATPGLQPWEPAAPQLYTATLELAARDGRRETVKAEVGFRSFATRDGKLFLNGRPIFLRGVAINPPNRGIPEALERSEKFATDYVRYLKSLHVNIIRIPDDDTWYRVCDREGMMVFGGNYSGRINGEGSNANHAAAARWFREEKFFPFVQHAALVVYALTNETPYAGANATRWESLLGDVYRELHAWDATRLYIANAGYGYGRVGDINDLHRYWGWYYQSPFTFLHLRDALVFPEKTQPLTFTECVGNYNGPDGRTNLTPNHKNPTSQQNWLGHASDTEQGQLGFEHQSFTIREATELFRRLRPINGELSGVFPFTILFNHWHDITSFADMDPKPAAGQMRTSYQPVLLSWEVYTPQVYAGSVLHPIAHVVNDDDRGADLRGATLAYEIRDSTERAVARGEMKLPDVAYYTTLRLPLTIQIPAALATGTYALHGRISRGAETISDNAVELFIGNDVFASPPAAVAPVRLFDPKGGTARTFERNHVPFALLGAGDAPTGDAPVVVGEEAAAALSPDQAQRLLGFVRAGGRLIVLRQPHAAAAALNALLPVPVKVATSDIDDPNYPPPVRPSRNSFNVNPERPAHPVFAGIDRRQLRVWSDYTSWDEQKPGMPHIYPVTDGIVLANKDDVASTAVLANYSVGLEGIALAEFFAGNGSVIYSAFDLAARAGVDPVADRLLRNLVAYAAQREGHERYVLIDSPIEWGHYQTEKGVLTGIDSGLMLNSRPALTGSYRDIKITVTPDGHEFAGGPGGWNSRPGIVYVPFGRRPFGPYSHRSWSGVPTPDAVMAQPVAKNTSPDAIYEEAEVISGNGGEGEGKFWCRIPAGRTVAVHRVFNPADKPLSVRVRENDREATATIPPGATEIIRVPLAPNTPAVETLIHGDRRLVLLETAFE